MERGRSGSYTRIVSFHEQLFIFHHRIDPDTLEQLINTMLARLPMFKQSVHLEVQERVLPIG